MEQYTRRLVEFACNLRFQDLPSDVINHLKLCILDTLGCGIFGSTTQWGRILIDYIHSFDKNKESAIWGTKHRAAVSNAALVNGTIVHSFEIDDVNISAHGAHPGGVVVTSALAVAEDKGGINGKDFLTAVALGYELLIRLILCTGISVYWRGFHPTGCCGTIGSAAATGRLLALNEEQMLNALGIAVPCPTGLMSGQYGSMVKRFWSGKAAQSGVVAAQLAGRGFTGIRDVLEVEFGFCKALSDDYDFTKLTVGLGKEYEIKHVGFKKYSCVATNFAALDAVREIMDERPINVENIKRITIKVNDFIKTHSGWEYKPEGIMAAQMNISYCVAMMLIEGDCFTDQFTQEKLRDPRMLRLIELIDVVVDPEMQKLPPSHRWASIVEIELKTGQRFSRRVDFYRGSVNNPMGYEEIKNKFKRVAEKKLSSRKANSIIAMVQKLEELKEMKELVRLLVP